MSQSVVFQPRSPFPRVEGIEYYQQLPNTTTMNGVQHAACCGAASLLTALVSRPLFNAHHLYFLSRPSMDLPSPRKQAMLWESLFTRNWFSQSEVGMGSVPRHTVSVFAVLLMNHYLHHQLDDCVGWRKQGFLSGMITGAVLCTLRHPFEVFAASVDAPGPKKFTGALDVAMTALKHRPQLLLQMYTGFTMMCVSASLYYGMFFGFFRMAEEDGQRHSSVRLAMWCYFAATGAEVVRYPFVYMKQELRKLNSQFKYTPSSYLYLLRKWRKSDGLSMAYTGFFASHPFLRALSGAFLLFSYSKITHAYAAYLHPPKSSKELIPRDPSKVALALQALPQ